MRAGFVVVIVEVGRHLVLERGRSSSGVAFSSLGLLLSRVQASKLRRVRSRSLAAGFCIGCGQHISELSLSKM